MARDADMNPDGPKEAGALAQIEGRLNEFVCGSSKFQARRLRAALVVFSVVVLLVGFGFMISIPQDVGL